jgi:hypothetical protein
MTVDDRLRDLAPDPTQSAERAARLRAQVLARATAVDAAPRSRPRRPVRRWVAAGLVTAAVASALVIGPTLVPDADSFAANALTPLARAAESTDVPPLSDGRALHRVTEYRTTEMSTGKVTLMTWDEWTLEDGTFYRQTTVDGKVGPVEYWDTPGSTELSPKDIADLPTDPAALLDAVEKSPEVTSTIASDRDPAKALLGTIIYGGYAPTKVWAAAIEAYGSFEDVQVRTDAAEGRTYVTEIVKGGPLVLSFDSNTGRLLGYDSTTTQDGRRTETMRVLVSKVEPRVPAGVVDGAKKLSDRL